ncbi:MAG: glycoside hydrolase [Elusimicrobia bacterium RIFOXYB2_FULL_49_7]|nr:MAG: glycoside hydrolase [Elusimicrobia bacterium RIFOXYB2_FULL_49_7]
MAIKKEYQKNKKFSKVTFTLPKEAAKGGRTVYVVGEFNNWETYATPLKKQKNGSFTTTLNLEAGREYQFRYLIDENIWENDAEADRYVPTPFGNSENSVISL